MHDPPLIGEPLLRAILESPRGVVIFALDRAYRYLAFNENHRRTMAAIWDVQIEVGRCVLDYITREDDREKARRSFDRALAGEHFTATESYGAEALRRRYYEDAYAPLRGPDGEVVGLTVYLTDITDAHARLLHVQKLESLGLMAAGVAHDFNNLLTGILGSAELALVELPEGAAGRDRIERIERSAMQAAALTRQLLAYAGQVPPETGPVDLTALVRDTETLLRASATRNVRIELGLTEPLPTVCADRTQLQQVLMNLVLNGAEAVGQDRPGRVRVTTGLREVGRADLARAYVDDGLALGTYVQLSVTDDGPGVDPSLLPRLFDPFFTTKFAGRGLGLASVLGIVRNHRGAVLVHSVPGTGATFEVLLPISTDEQRPPPEPAATEDIGAVLVVDDEEAVRELTAEILERMGYHVLRAADGEEGVALLEAHRDQVRAVFLDMTMPKLDGEAAFRRVRLIRPDVPVVVVSGWTREHRRLRFLEHEAGVAFLSKPFRLAQLQDAIRGALDKA